MALEEDAEIVIEAVDVVKNDVIEEVFEVEVETVAVAALDVVDIDLGELLCVTDNVEREEEEVVVALVNLDRVDERRELEGVVTLLEIVDCGVLLLLVLPLQYP